MCVCVCELGGNSLVNSRRETMAGRERGYGKTARCNSASLFPKHDERRRCRRRRQPMEIQFFPRRPVPLHLTFRSHRSSFKLFIFLASFLALPWGEFAAVTTTETRARASPCQLSKERQVIAFKSICQYFKHFKLAHSCRTRKRHGSPTITQNDREV